ncbi:hypothetical protein ULMS_10350 [Patiriisocius marinistellae]|uniref:MAM domain-containing protein n=1 Tax=Patiriisocius marinistellae TaxID=2494560 RepID=A0A5J4FT26_9FLAO|nr:hypothetical protein [Patiriisocius marinistellae]GEQ85527.1 hypothetical protein ULMS_10350 [Patiriisocius marinistellae]
MKFLTISKNIFLVSSCFLLCSLFTNAQVGINTTTPSASSALDITSTNKGFLMTKVALTGTDDMTTITPSPTIGLLVYNTASTGSSGTEVVPGFYYFNGTSWRRFYTQGYTLSYDQTTEITASANDTEYVLLPGLDTGDITVPFSGTYQIRVEGYYAAGNLIDTSGDGAAQGSISLAMSSANSGGGGSPGGCTGGITTYPYNESFESGLGSWSQSGADDINWTRDQNGTPSSFTGPSRGSSGIFNSWYMYIEATNNFNKNAILNSPCFDLTSSPAATFTFDYHMYGSTMGSIDLEASDDNGATWTSLWTNSGNKGNSWFTHSVDLSPYIGGSVQLRFNGTTGPNFRSDIAIDNINLTETTTGGTFATVKETYLTTSSKRLGSVSVNNLAQSASILVNMELNAGVTYRFVVRGREWLANNTSVGSFGKNTNGYSGNTLNDAQRGTMTISLIKQY